MCVWCCVCGAVCVCRYLLYKAVHGANDSIVQTERLFIIQDETEQPCLAPNWMNFA